MKNDNITVYIDGFNLYRAIDDLGKPHLKWADLWSLADSLTRQNQILTNVKYYSAYATWRPDDYYRHRQYVKALQAKGVETVMSEFKAGRQTCNTCGATWTRHEEKETDVFMATDIVEDLFTDQFDVAILITADTDVRPAVNKVIARKGKYAFVATPPKRFNRARSLSPSIEITQGRLAKHLLSQSVVDAVGNEVATRPAAYDPPTS